MRGFLVTLAKRRAVDRLRRRLAYRRATDRLETQMRAEFNDKMREPGIFSTTDPRESNALRLPNTTGAKETRQER